MSSLGRQSAEAPAEDEDIAMMDAGDAGEGGEEEISLA